MATNADKVVDDDKEVTEDDLRSLKYDNDEVETSEEADETSESEEAEDETEEASEDDGQTDDQTEEDESEDKEESKSDEDTSEYVKKFPNIKGDTLEDYARNLEEAYSNSTAEALRLKHELDGKQTDSEKVGDDAEEEKQVSDPVLLYARQKMDEEIASAFQEFSKHYPQVNDQAEYNKFTEEVATLSQTIMNRQKRMASPKELYSKAAVILGWEPDESTSVPTSKDRLKVALKDSAASSKTSSTGKGAAKKSKVTDEMVRANRLMYPDKTDAQIREELEPYVQ